LRGFALPVVPDSFLAAADNYRKSYRLLTKGLRDKLHVENRAKARQTARGKRDKLHVATLTYPQKHGFL